MSLDVNNYSSVNEQLREMITSFLSRHPALTVNALAGRSGVAPTTLRRLIQDESRSEVAPHSVLALVSYLLREKKLSKLIHIVEGPVGELLRKSFDQFIYDENESDHLIENELNEIFKDKLNYLIYKMAANQCGVTLEELKDSFGLFGLKKLEELINKGLVIQDENGLFHAREKNFSVDLKRAHELTHVLVDQFKPDDVHKGYGLFYSLSEGLNDKGINEVKKIELEAVKKIHTVMNNKEFIGSIPYFSIVLSDVLGLTPNEELIREVLQ
jgi:hypothetical protein